MSEITGQTGPRTAATPVVHESYSFACMRCGHGWEQSYEIEHHTDARATRSSSTSRTAVSCRPR